MKEKVIELVKQSLNLSQDFNETELVNSDLFAYGMDSITAIQLIIMLESEFDVEFEDEDLMLHTVQTVDTILNTLNKYIQNK